MYSPNFLRGMPARLLPALLLMLLLAGAAHGHRVNIFAWLEGGQVVVQCGFSSKTPVRQGEITVFAHAGNQPLLEGRTDDAGMFRFATPTEAKTHGLRIRVRAGEGHQNQWIMEAGEFADAAPEPAPAPTAAPENTPRLPESGGQQITAEEIARIVNVALDSKLAPVKRELAALRESPPGLKEIVGGVGWLVGLAGIGLYFRGRSPRNSALRADRMAKTGQ